MARIGEVILCDNDNNYNATFVQDDVGVIRMSTYDDMCDIEDLRDMMQKAKEVFSLNSNEEDSKK